MTSLEHLLPPGKRKIYNMTANLEPDNVFFFSPDIMALEPSFDVPIVNITVVAGKTAVLPCSIDSLGDFKVSHIYTATCKIVIYIASSAEWNVKVAYSTFSYNFNDLNNCTISSKLKFKRSLLYIPH